MRKRNRLENDCLDILDYASKEWPRWVSIGEIARERCIPNSTIRNICSISKRGFFIKYTENGCIIHNDVFDKIAKKYRYDYVIKKMENDRKRLSWYISAVKQSFT